MSARKRGASVLDPFYEGGVWRAWNTPADGLPHRPGFQLMALLFHCGNGHTFVRDWGGDCPICKVDWWADQFGKVERTALPIS